MTLDDTENIKNAIKLVNELYEALENFHERNSLNNIASQLGFTRAFLETLVARYPDVEREVRDRIASYRYNYTLKV